MRAMLTPSSIMSMACLPQTLGQLGLLPAGGVALVVRESGTASGWLTEQGIPTPFGSEEITSLNGGVDQWHGLRMGTKFRFVFGGNSGYICACTNAGSVLIHGGSLWHPRGDIIVATSSWRRNGAILASA